MKDFNFKKAFGQNFLNDGSVIKNIINKTNIQENSLVVEVGPGSGVLTKELARVAKDVLCYEIDNSLENILDQNLLGVNNVRIIFNDFLTQDLNNDVKKYNYEHLYFVSNLPYYITTPILEKVIASNLQFDGITIMLQKEVGERFMAHPRSREYGSITVFLNYYFNVNKLFVVDRTKFTPMPNVDSVVLSLVPKINRIKANNEEVFFTLIKDSFKFKRKNLHNNLKGYDLNKVENILDKYNLNLTARAEELSLEIFIDLANNL